MNPLLFVYGTLRPGSSHAMALFLAERAAYLGPAKTRGKLYDLGRYPGLVASAADSAADSDWVRGDLMELTDPEATLRELDKYEGCAPATAAPHYERRCVEIVADGGSTKQAWVYFYLGEAAEERLIRSGDYRASFTIARGCY